MSSMIVVLSYLAALAAAVFLLWRFSHVKWVWHLAALAIAIGIGFMPPVKDLPGALYDLLIGSAFLFLLIWGVGEAVFRMLHLPRHI